MKADSLPTPAASCRMPPLPRSRRIARLQEGDLLLTCKGSLLQSLGKVGIMSPVRR